MDVNEFSVTGTLVGGYTSRGQTLAFPLGPEMVSNNGYLSRFWEVTSATTQEVEISLRGIGDVHYPSASLMPVGFDSRLWMYDASWNPLLFNDDAYAASPGANVAPESSWGGPDAYWSYMKVTLEAGVTYYFEVSSYTAGDNFEYRLQFNPGAGISAIPWVPPATPVELYEISTDYPVSNNGYNRNWGAGANGYFMMLPDGWTADAEPPLGMVAGFTFGAIINEMPVVKFDGVPIRQVSRWYGWDYGVDEPVIWNDYFPQGNGRTFFRIFFAKTDPTLITFEWADASLAPTTIEWQKLPLVLDATLVNYTDPDPQDMLWSGGSIRFTGRNLTGALIGATYGPYADLGGADLFQVSGSDTSVDVSWLGNHDGSYGLTVFQLAWNKDVFSNSEYRRPRISGFASGWRFKNVNPWPAWPPVGTYLRSMTISPNPIVVYVGHTATFTVTGNYSDATTAPLTTGLTYYDNARYVMTVDPNTGVITGVGTGDDQPVVVHHAAEFVSSSAMVHVVEVPTSFNLTPVLPTVPVGQSQQFVVTGHFATAPDEQLTAGLVWDTDNHSIATVDANGLLTRIAPGSVNIFVTLSINGMSANTVVA